MTNLIVSNVLRESSPAPEYLVSIVPAERFLKVMEQYHVLPVPLDRPAILLEPSVSLVKQERIPLAQDHLVILVLLGRSRVLGQYHAFPVQRQKAATLIRPAVKNVALESIPLPIPPPVLTVLKEPLHQHLDPLIVQSASQEAMPVVQEILHVLSVKLDLILLILGPHLALPVTREERPLWDPHHQHLVHHAMKALMLLSLEPA